MRKALSILILTCLILCISCSGVENDTDTSKQNADTVVYKDGYIGPNLWCALFCAGEYETKACSIDDVYITLYYGVDLQFRFDSSEENKNPIIVTANNYNHSEKITLIEHEVDEMFTEKYECECEIGTKKMSFNHFKKIKIPSELFLGESGTIIIKIDQNDDENQKTREYGYGQISIYYVVKNGLVYLS